MNRAWVAALRECGPARAGGGAAGAIEAAEGKQARGELFGETLPASTLTGVASLASPDYLVEVEAVAVLD